MRELNLKKMQTSHFVKLIEKHPFLYELSLIVWNFPLFRRIYRPLPKLYGNVLQVGCGTGILNTYLKKRGDSCSIDNLDINEKYLMYGKKLKRYDNYIAENIETFKSKKKYNIILFSRSFHHIRKVKKALGNCSNLLSDEGRIIIFDIACQEFHAVAFLKKTFTHFTIDFASLFKALDSSITNFSHNDWISEKLVIFLKPVEHQSVYPFDISIFRNKFKNFLDSTINPKEKFYLDKLFHEKPVVLKYGLEVYSILLGYLDFFPKKMAVNNDVSRETYLLFLEDRYRMFHCFYEHRQGLLERLSYVKQQELIGSISDSMIETYHTIVQRLNIICKVYLKVTVKANFLRGKDLISYIATSFASLHNQLREIKEIEEKLLYQRGQISLY